MTGPRLDEVAVGDRLPPETIPLTRTLIVATAIASRDYQDVHHDPDLAVERGSKDIFMNILTSNAMVERYVTRWSGPRAVVRRLRVRLGAPNYPGDRMELTGEVTAADPATGRITVDVRGANSLGDHVTGLVELELPVEAAAVGVGR